MYKVVLAPGDSSRKSHRGLIKTECGKMHDWNMWWGGGGMWFGPLWMILWLVLLVAGIVALVRWLVRPGASVSRQARSARDILDERYARGEIDRDEYMKRKQDLG